MPEVVDTAFVRIRPSVAGFQAEAGQRIRTAMVGVQADTARAGVAARTATRDFDRFGRGLVLTEARALGLHSILGSVSAAFVGGVGIASLVHTATDEFGQMTRVAATTNAILAATGGAAHISATGVQALASAIEHKTGIDDEQVKSAENVLLTFGRVRNEVGRGNDVFTRATQASADLSRVLGGDVSGAARQLGVALTDPERGLTRLRRSGVIFTAAQERQIKTLAQTGQLLRAQTLILDIVSQKVGGTAEAVGRTLPGQLNILRERAKDALGEYVHRLSESHDAAEAARQGGADLAAGFHAVEGAVRTLGPPLVSAAKAAHAATAAIGVGPLVAAVVGYKAVGASVALAGRAQSAYAKVAAVAAGTNGALAASSVEATAALRAETAALTGVTVATRGYVTASGIAVIENDRIAASAVSTGLAARASAAGLGASRVALAAVGGLIGAAALGAGALAAGLFLVRRAGDDAAGGINSARRALEGFNQHVTAVQQIRIRITGAREAINQSRSVARVAEQTLEAAQARQAASTAPAGSLEQRALAGQVATARAQLTAATTAQTRAELALSRANADLTAEQAKAPAVIGATTQRILEQTAALRHQTLLGGQGQFAGLGIPTDLGQSTAAVTRAVTQFDSLMEKLGSSGTRAERVAAGALGRIAAILHHLPTERQIRISFALAGGGANIDDILRRLDVGGLDVGLQQQLIANAHAATARAIGGENVALAQQFAAAQRILRTEEKKLATRKEAAATARQETQAARDAVQGATDALTNANQQLADSQRALADSITAGRNAVNAAVRDAKTNLRSIADSIADAIGRATDAGATRVGPTGPLAQRFRQLRDQILAGQGGPDTQRAAQEVAARLQAQQGGGDDVAARAKRRLDDLSDSFSRGRIGAGQFNTGVQRVLHDFGLNLRTFGRTFGSAALNDLRDQLTASQQQAGAIAVGPRRPGGGEAPNIVRPLDAVAAAQRDTRNATRDVARATREVAREQRSLQQKQNALTRDANRELRAIRIAAQAQLRVTRQQEKIRKPKPTGKAGKDAQDVATAGAGSP